MERFAPNIKKFQEMETPRRMLSLGKRPFYPKYQKIFLKESPSYLFHNETMHFSAKSQKN